MSRLSFSNQVSELLNQLVLLHDDMYDEGNVSDKYELQRVIKAFTNPSEFISLEDNMTAVMDCMSSLEKKHHAPNLDILRGRHRRQDRQLIIDNIQALKSLVTKGDGPRELRRVLGNVIDNKRQINQASYALRMLEKGLEPVLIRSFVTSQEKAKAMSTAADGTEVRDQFVALQLFAQLYDTDADFKALMTVKKSHHSLFASTKSEKTAVIQSDKFKLCCSEDEGRPRLAGLPRHCIDLVKVSLVVDQYLASKAEVTEPTTLLSK